MLLQLVNQELQKIQIYLKTLTYITTLLNLSLTDSHADITLLCINNKWSYKLRQDLCIYKSNELEPRFIEIINK